MIDWQSSASHVLLNPRMPDRERTALESYVIPLPGHIWLATSGTTGALKMTALSKDAMLASAAAVNRRLESTAGDVWCCVLPTFHVGGLGIYARAHLSGAKVVAMPWGADEFAKKKGITLASLVPAQVSDLVSAGLRAPASLRAIVVGGGALSSELYEGARRLGWPVLPSYGMTETCSQVATAEPGSPALMMLDHAVAGVEADGRLRFQGSSLLTGYGTAEGFIDPRQDGWFVTNDIGEVHERALRVIGRSGEFVKIGGELVALARLDRIAESVAGAKAAVVAMPDARLGHVIWLAVEPGIDEAAVAREYDERVLPFERVRQVVRVARLPRTELGKLKRNELQAQVSRIME